MQSIQDFQEYLQTYIADLLAVHNEESKQHIEVVNGELIENLDSRISGAVSDINLSNQDSFSNVAEQYQRLVGLIQRDLVE